MGLTKVYYIRKSKPENWRVIRQLNGSGEEKYKVQYKAWYGLWNDEQYTCSYSGGNYTKWYDTLEEVDAAVDTKIEGCRKWVIDSDVKHAVINFK